jgi:hypothetical protein
MQITKTQKLYIYDKSEHCLVLLLMLRLFWSRNEPRGAIKELSLCPSAVRHATQLASALCCCQSVHPQSVFRETDFALPPQRIFYLNVQPIQFYGRLIYFNCSSGRFVTFIHSISSYARQPTSSRK